MLMEIYAQAKHSIGTRLIFSSASLTNPITMYHPDHYYHISLREILV